MARKLPSEKGALELLEEAVHLLRLAPLSALLCYYIGALPFVLGFLFFWADMSRSAFAASHCGRAAFGLSLLFFWMKTWQSLFSTELSATFTGKNTGRKTLSQIGQIAFQQLILQPSALFVLPFSTLIILPLGWVYAFYQNATVLGKNENARALFQESARLATLSPKQNHLTLLFLGAFAFFIWLNMITLIFVVPGLLKTFLGIETMFTQSGGLALLNTTFFAATFALTWLCIDPLVKSIYCLRCFYGQAITTGEDLKVELKTYSGAKVALLAALLFFSVSLGKVAAQTETAPPPTVSVPELNRSIDEVLEQPEFTWRSPREKVEESDEKRGWFATFVHSIYETLAGWMRSFRNVLRDFLEWLEKFIGRHVHPSSHSGSGEGWRSALEILVYLLLVVIASALALLFLRMWKRRQRESRVVLATAIPAQPDLTDENIAANQLPEDEWLRLARECMAKGELRLALRAFYLAGLAHLGGRELIRIAKFKSNREYENELRRRARAFPDLQSAFGQNVFLFDCVWYGRHAVTVESLQQFQSNLERIRAC
ncbi:MAG: DUF4129 domain-containing protein [Verrucomicrobiota bacterium]